MLNTVTKVFNQLVIMFLVQIIKIFIAKMTLTQKNY